MQNDVLHIHLGCFGRKDDDFIICPSIENKIYTLNSEFPYYSQIMDYLDNCRLFDLPLSDFNAIRNFMAMFRNKFEIPLKPMWVERKYLNYQKFIVDHRNCGLYLKLTLASGE